VRSAANVAWFAGPAVTVAYLAGAALATSHRKRAQREPLVDAISEAGLALGVVWASMQIANRLAPGGEASRVGFESVQVLLAWDSIGLWCGAACILGLVSPVFNGFRGSDGLAAATVVVAAYAPSLLVAAVGAYALGFAVFRGRSRDAVAVALAVVPTYEWVAWAGDVQRGWGVTHGPELALWTAAVVSILLTAWWRPGEPAAAS
jgi:UDP-N-acetylmuramyl pentapeptide phosphotransferase/UDP-N-acetylglucosamine-1-phosphate transferase